ncbi:DUF418 domain-containing protein [Dysgonomonas sp. 216]|uniref:DUF418 domain-containing protein n=1 Tax=Dysgonomonas sp. 216 TaxID=2302934 RepID=UPI0013D2431E|nr:DUF418 domain-containing protein [Dysgonomonas sp. 216]NDW19659.1 DUF418 domain-containing protein [Dysgonomonas sp. 216]
MTNNLIKTNSRIDIADVLRGLAVMGIIILHAIEHFNFYSYPDTSTQSDLLNFTDKAIWDSLFFTFGGKAYAVFALLFGFSFFIQDDNERRRGRDFRMRFMWRLVLLFIIGNFNAMFFTGEILVLYSLVGFVLVLVCRLPNKVLIAIAILLLLQPMEWWKLFETLLNPSAETTGSLAGYYFNEAYKVQENGTFLETARMNLWEGQLASLTWAWEHGRMFQTAALFIFGMIIGRKGLFLYSPQNMKIWVQVLTISIVCYFPLQGFADMLPEFMENKQALFSANLIITSLAKFSFMLILLSGVILLFYTFDKVRKFLMNFSSYGRMSLTNYLTQSIIGSMLFYNWGFGLHNKLGITHSFLVGVLLFLIQFVFCHWWMKKHKHGPFEYIWKKATWIGLNRK